MWLEGWKYRLPINVDFPGSATPGVYDVEFNIEPIHKTFWEYVASDGSDIRITESDGLTELVYQRTAWDYANQTATLQVQDVTFNQAGSRKQIFIYFGNSSAGDVATAFTPGTLYTGELHDFRDYAITTLFLLSITRERDLSITVKNDEDVLIVLDCTQYLKTLIRQNTEIDNFRVVIEGSDGTDVTATTLQGLKVLEKFAIIYLQTISTVGSYTIKAYISLADPDFSIIRKDITLTIEE